VLRCTPRRSCFSVSAANQRSTRLSHEASVGEVEVETRALREAALDELRLVGAVVVEDEVNVEFGGHLLIDAIEELAEFHRAVPPVAFSDHLAGLDHERREEGSGTVT
jgi:hypothetical protein